MTTFEFPPWSSTRQTPIAARLVWVRVEGTAETGDGASFTRGASRVEAGRLVRAKWRCDVAAVFCGRQLAFLFLGFRQVNRSPQ